MPGATAKQGLNRSVASAADRCRAIGAIVDIQWRAKQLQRDVGCDLRQASGHYARVWQLADERAW